MNKGRNWATTSSKIIHKSQWISLRVDEIERPDGSKDSYEWLERRSFALIIPKKEDKFFLVRIYRYPVKSYSWEFPKGLLEEGEDTKGTALRELEEEAGLKAKKIKLLGNFWTANGIMAQDFYVYLAENFEKGVQKLEATEHDLIIKSFTLSQIKKMIKKGEIKDSSTVTALMRFLIT